jgi:hypothetical protein
MIKYKLPTITTFTVTPGSRKIDYVADFSKDDSAATATLSWTGQATGSTTVTSSSSSQSYSPLAAGTYNFTLTITNASTNALTGSATAVQNSKVVTGVATYQFNFGNRLYVGTNGTIRLDVPTGVQTPSYYPTPEYSAAGRLVAVFPKDLVQGNSNLSTADGNGYLLYYSDDNNYFIRWDGYTYNNAGVAAQRVTYYARFTKPIVSGGVTTNYPYVDIYMQNRGSSVGTSSYNIGYYADGIEYGTSYGNTVAANTIYRIYTDGRAAETITYMPTPTAAEMLSFGPITAKNTVGASFSSADEGYSSVLTSANQYVVPTLTVGTVTSTNTDISIPFTTGAAYSSYDIDVKTVSHTGTSITGYPKNSETASPAVISSLTGGTTYYITMTPKNSLGIKGSPIQFTKDTPSTPGNLSSVVLKSFANGYLRLFATTGTNTTKIQYYAVRYNPSIFSVEYIPSSGSTTFNASSSTSYYVGQIDASAKSFNGSYSWTTSSTPYNGTAPGTSTTSGSALATGADNPTISYTTTAGDGKIDLSSIALGGAGNYYTIDVKTTSQTGTSITGYPKVQQTATTQSITGTNGTTYYIRLTPHYYYTIDSTTDSNSIKYTGTSADASAAPAAALGAFTIYAANASVAPAAPTPTITRQSTTSNNLLISWAATKPADVASYNQIIWGEAFSSTYTTEATAGTFGGTLNNYNGSAVYNNPTGPYEDFWVIVDNGTTEKSFNIKIEAVGTNASRKAGAFWSESTGAGSYTVEYTISGSTTLTNTSYVSSALSSTTRSFEVTLGTGGGTFTLNQVRAWSNTNGTGAFKYGALLSGQSLSVTPTPKSGISTAASGNFIFYKAASKPANPSAPSVIYRS